MHSLKKIAVSIAGIGIVFCADSASLDVYCTSQQVPALGLTGVDPSKIFIVDAHKVAEEQLNSKYLRNVKSIEEAQKIWPLIESSPEFRSMVDSGERAGLAIKKILADYRLDYLPAFVCTKQNNDSATIGVIYGGTYSNALTECGQWVPARGGK